MTNTPSISPRPPNSSRNNRGPLPLAIAGALIFAAAAFLIALSIHRSYSLGHDKTMYDPIYRWRESFAVTLSGMQDKPLHGYLGYRSLRDYLNSHGLGLMEGEATPLPTFQERERLILDGPRVDRLLQDASKAPIDYSLPPVIIIGNEKGLADFYYMAFKLFGIELNSLVVFYYCLLALSALMFFISFRQSPFCLFLLMAYLIGHYHMIGHASYWTLGWGEAPDPDGIRTVHNSRFFPVLSLLPAMHLFLLVVRRARASGLQVGLAAAQTLLLCFLIFCRVVSVWQAGAVLGVGLFFFFDSRILQRAPGWKLRLAMIRQAAVRAWPATVVLAGLIGVVSYSYTALDSRYKSETKTHVFWHNMYSGLVSSSPELTKIYSYNEDRFGDNIAYMAVLFYLRERKEVPPTFAYVSDGVIYINAMWDMGAYDRVVRRVFFRTIARHPWLAIKAYAYDMPREQIRMLQPLHVFEPRVYGATYLLGLAAALLSLLFGVPPVGREQIADALKACGVGVAFSSATTFASPSPLIFDTVLFYLILGILLTAYVPLLAVALKRSGRQQRVST